MGMNKLMQKKLPPTKITSASHGKSRIQLLLRTLAASKIKECK
jgi:hypothetical protein